MTEECTKAFADLDKAFKNQGMTSLLKRPKMMAADPVAPDDDCYDFGVFDGSAANSDRCMPQWDELSNACFLNWTDDCSPAFNKLNDAIASWDGKGLALRKAMALAKHRHRTMEIIEPRDPECYNKGLFQNWDDPDECSLEWFAFWDACEAEGKFWDDVCQGPNGKLEDFFAKNPVIMMQALTKKAQFMRQVESA